MTSAGERVVVVFEPVADQAAMVRMAIRLANRQLRPSPCCFDSGDPAHVAERLTEARADLVVWDVSPATTYYCRVLERLLNARTLTARNLVVTSTDAPRLAMYLGAAAGALCILQKPYDIDVLVLELERLAALERRKVAT